MDKNDILNYVTETPGNTNRAVLGGMLDSMNTGGATYELIHINGQTTEQSQKVSAKGTTTYNFMPTEAIEINKIVAMWFRIKNAGKVFMPMMGAMNGSPGQFMQMGVNVFNPGSSEITVVTGGESPDFTLEVLVEK